MFVATLVHGASAAARADVAACPAVGCSAARTLQAALDRARRASGAPGTAAAVARNGAIVWAGESGTVDLGTGAPVRADTLFSLASVSKLFTAAMIFKLAQEHALSLHDPIARYVGAAVPDSGAITVEQLMGHTSGYADAEDDPWMLHRLADPNYAWTRAAVMARQRAPRRAPGSRFAYCNSCYVILGGVIENAGDASVQAILEREIIDPLHLQGSVDIARTQSFAPRISHGYDWQHAHLVDASAGARGLGISTAVWGPVWTDGGVIATASSVARFTDALFSARVVSSASLRTMLEPGRHEEILESAKLDGRTWRGHSGFYYGYTAETWYDAGRRLTITVLANRTDDGDPATEIWNRLTLAFDRLPHT